VVNDSAVGAGLLQFTYSGSWGYAGGAPAKHGSDDHYSDTAGSTAVLRFTGTAVRLVGSRAPWHGRAAVSIDGGPETLVDYYAATRQDGVALFSRAGLAAGEHRISIRATGTGATTATGTTVTVDRIDITNAPAAATTPPPALPAPAPTTPAPITPAPVAPVPAPSAPVVSETTVVNDSAVGAGLLQFTYSGSWGYAGGAPAKHGSDDHYSDTAGSTAVLRFTGTAVRLVGSRAPWHGRAAVSIDGGPETLVDYYAATRQDGVALFSRAGLAAGEHRISIRATGTGATTATGTTVTVDRIDITNAPAAATSPPPALPAPAPTTPAPITPAPVAPVPAPSAPVVSETTVVNDSAVGAGLLQFTYSGSWGYAGGAPAKHGSDDHYSDTAGSTAVLRFTGTAVRLVGSRAPWHGRAAVSIDGGPETLVDYYAATRQDGVALFSRAGLAAGEHRISIRATGTGATTATGTTVTVDRIDITN
jgi:hypothetical protein